MTKLNKYENNESTSTDTVAVGAKQPIAVNEIRLYRVPISTDIEASLTGDVWVYAMSEVEAAAKVQAQIDDDMLDDDIEMRDDGYGLTMSYGELSQSFADVGIDESHIEVIDDDVDLEDVLLEEAKELEAQISWDTDTLAKKKAFLESVIAAENIGAAA